MTSVVILIHQEVLPFSLVKGL